MKKGCVLIVDDNLSILKSLQLLLKPEYQKIDILSNPEQLPGMLKAYNYDLILLDMNFKTGINTGNEGLFWLKEILKSDEDAVVVLITAYGDVELAVKGIKQGATDFVQKPWDAEKLIATLNSAYKLRSSKKEISKLKNTQQILTDHATKNHQQIIGKSKAIQHIFSVIDKVAATDANILILGENGTGKDLFARLVHQKSKRSKEVFIAVDMGSVSDSLFESELFGHQKGAFTDAKENRIGKIEAAHGGTLFLDEIANLPFSMQSKILRALQEKQITRLGSNHLMDVDIRLISATNKPIEKLIKEGLFREDLYFRLNTIEITIPPLRDRQDDIVLIAEFFLKKYREKYDKPQLKLTSEALKKLIEYHWPGNVRELKHSIEKAVILSTNENLKSTDFIFKVEPEEQDEMSGIHLIELEKKALRKAMVLMNNNVSKVAKELGMSRTTLYKKIKKYDL